LDDRVAAERIWEWGDDDVAWATIGNFFAAAVATMDLARIPFGRGLAKGVFA
jgi:hypothetical protein